MQDIVFYVAANETLGMVRDYSNMNNASAPVLTLGVAVCLRIRLFADIKVPTPYPVTSLSGITDWHWSMDADFDRSTACKLVADEGGISVHTVTDTINGSTMSFTEFVIPISNMNTEELAAWLGNDGTKSGLTGELVGYDSEGHAVFVLQIEGFKVRNRVAGLSDPTAVDEGFVTRIIADSMIQTAVSASAATKQDKLTAATGITITGGTQVSINLAAGERMAVISGNTVAQLRYFPITNITGNTVTLAAGSAYRMNATTGTKTLYAENMDDDTFGLEGHIEIFVANAGNIQTGKLAGGTTEVILADALEPDAVNNCTVRFHDHKAIISVEDHVAGHIVTLAGGTYTTEEGTLYYWLMQPNTASDAATQYIGFDARTNNTPVSFEGAANTAVKHVVGNGYAQTLLTGNVAPAAALTVSDLGLQNVTVTGGTLTLGDAYIPSGSTVAVSGGGLAVEKVSGNGGVIDLGYNSATQTGGTRINVYRQGTAYVANCIVKNAKQTDEVNYGAFNVESSTLILSGTTISDCVASAYAGVRAYLESSLLELHDCLVTSNTGFANNTNNLQFIGIGAQYGATVKLYGSTVTGSIPSGTSTDAADIFIVGSATNFEAHGDNIIGKVRLQNGNLKIVDGTTKIESYVLGQNAAVSGTVTISSGATLDLTGNSEPTPIAPGGGIVFESGGATVLVGSDTASSSYMMDNVTLPAGAKLTNTNVVNLTGSNVVISSGSTISASGCTFTSGGNVLTNGGVVYMAGSGAQASFYDVAFTSNTGSRGGAIHCVNGASASFVSCSFVGNTGSLDQQASNAFYLGAVTITISGCLFDNNQNIRLTNSAGKLIFAGSNVFRGKITDPGSVTISSGAILDLTGNANSAPIYPAGAITIPAGAVVKIIGSDGPTSSAYLSELALTGTTITNVPSVLGATVTVPATGGPWEVHFADNTSSIYSATGTERQEVLAGAVTYIGGQ